MVYRPSPSDSAVRGVPTTLTPTRATGVPVSRARTTPAIAPLESWAVAPPAAAPMRAQRARQGGARPPHRAPEPRQTIVRTISTRDFSRATRSTSRQINRLILLNLVRELQSISRADLARRMAVGRGMVTTLVKELLAEGAVYEGALADVPRGRRPKLR